MTGRATKTVSDESETLGVEDLAHKDAPDQDMECTSSKNECDAHTVISVVEPASVESPEIQPVSKEVNEASDVIRSVSQYALCSGLFQTSEDYSPGPSSNLFSSPSDDSLASNITVCNLKEVISSAKLDSNDCGGSEASKCSLVAVSDQTAFSSEASFSSTHVKTSDECFPVGKTGSDASSVVTAEGIAGIMNEVRDECTSPAPVCDTTEPVLLVKEKPDDSPQVQESVVVGSTEADAGENFPKSRVLKGKGAKLLKSSKKQMPSKEESFPAEKEVITSREAPIPSQEVAISPIQSHKVEQVMKQTPEDSGEIKRTFGMHALSPGLFSISEEDVEGPSNLFDPPSDTSLASDINIHKVKEGISSATLETSFVSCLDPDEFPMISNTRSEASSAVPVEAICDRSAESASSAPVCGTTETVLVMKKKNDNSEEVKESVVMGSTEAESRVLKGKGAKYLKSSKKRMTSQEEFHPTEKEETSISSKEVAQQHKKTD